MTAASAPAVCAMCERERTPEGDPDYHPLQVLQGQPLGWYSGEDGEICGPCMTEIVRGQ